MDFINIISILIGIAGLIGTIYYGIKSSKLENQIRRFSWNDIEIGVDTMMKKTLSSFKPDVIFSVSPPGNVVAGLFILRNNKTLQHLSCFSMRACDKAKSPEQNTAMTFITSKWCYEIPEAILNYRDKNILIIEDSVVTGDSLERLLDFFNKKGFQRKKIMTSTILATESALNAQKGPDIYCYRVPDTNIHMPWGKLGGAYY